MYNPSDVGKKGTIFGLPYSLEESDLIFLPIHLDVTVSYGAGTSMAPYLILEESSQLDLSLVFIDKPWTLKMAMGSGLVDPEQNEYHRLLAEKIIQNLENDGDPLEVEQEVESVNNFCEMIHQQIEQQCEKLIYGGKLVGVVGGDHSSSLGLMRALSRKHEYGILQIDAHMDLRNSYEGFTYSHASIMYHALGLNNVKSLTQVGIRDFSEEEELYIENSKTPIHVFFDERMYHDMLGGNSWSNICDSIIATLPEQVYISFDVDGLIPSLCPNTGTPVPGGLDFNSAMYLTEQVVKSGRKIIGFDLCEVGNGVWDANVGARILYRLAALMGVSSGLLNFK